VVVFLVVLFIVDPFVDFELFLSAGFRVLALAMPVFFSGATNFAFGFLVASGAAAMVAG
jgi:hypothetical protein